MSSAANYPIYEELTTAGTTSLFYFTEKHYIETHPPLELETFKEKHSPKPKSKWLKKRIKRRY